MFVIDLNTTLDCIYDVLKDIWYPCGEQSLFKNLLRLLKSQNFK